MAIIFCLRLLAAILHHNKPRTKIAKSFFMFNTTNKSQTISPSARSNKNNNTVAGQETTKSILSFRPRKEQELKK
jgi:hypothetical protein